MVADPGCAILQQRTLSEEDFMATWKTKKGERRTNVSQESDERPLGLRRPGPRQGTRLEFPAGEPDLEALRSATREWLVPLLVERFLREQGIELRACSQFDPGKKGSPIYR
jgi:hypothetical protein